MFLDPIERKSEIEHVCMYGVSITPGKGIHRGMRWELKQIVDSHPLGYVGNRSIPHLSTDLDNILLNIHIQAIDKLWTRIIKSTRPRS